MYEAENFERIFDFGKCDNVVFYNGRTRTGNNVLMMVKGGGHIVVPANVSITVDKGFARCETEGPVTDGSTVVGGGAHAPPPSLVSGAAQSHWRVLAEDPRLRDDVTVLPGDSVSSVGARSRDSGSEFGRRYSHQN